MAEWASEGAASQHTVHVTLKGLDNDTYRGKVVLRNLSLILGVHPGVHPELGHRPVANMSDPLPGSPGHPEDPTGASYYVIAVVLVYGMSIVMLIASHIKRKHRKLMEDRQIDKYLREFQVVKEKSSRDSYKNLKRSIMAKLNMNNRNQTYRTLSHTILPMIAVGLPPISDEQLPEADALSTSGLRRASLQAGLFRHVQSSLNGSRPRRASDFDIHWRHLHGASLHGPSLHGSSLHGARDGSLESCDSLRGRANGSTTRSLPSTIEERESPSLSNEMSTVIEISDDDSPQSKAASDAPTTATTELSQPAATSGQSPRPKTTERRARADAERGYYRPISISRACRVYEIPRNTSAELISPGGVHVALPGGTLFNYGKPSRARGRPDSHTAAQDNGPRGTNDQRSDRYDDDYSMVIGQGAGESALMKRSPDQNDNRLVVIDDGWKGQRSRSPAGSPPTSSPRQESPRLGEMHSLTDPHSIKSKLYERRMSKKLSEQGAEKARHRADGDGTAPDPEREDSAPGGGPSSRSPVRSFVKPLRIDLPPGGGHRSGARLSPQPADVRSSGHVDAPRRSSWSSSDRSGSQPRTENAHRKSPFLALPSGSPFGKTTPDSSEVCSEASSESSEVWSAARQAVSSQPEASGDGPAHRPSYTDLEFRGLGSTPLLTPKEGRRLDFNRDSRSTSPAYSQSSDSDKHVHHVTSV